MNHPPQLRRRLAAAATAAVTLTVTLTALAGMPYILWQATGIPWPEHVTSLSDAATRLTQPISDPLIIDLLALIGWACWAAFASTILRETAWYATHLPRLLRDRHAHHEHVASLSVKGSLAALCIGTLAVALLTVWRPQTATAQQRVLPEQARPPLAATAPQNPVPAPAPTTRLAPAILAATETSQAKPMAEQAQAVRHVEYTVVAGDTLWDVAHAHMGDALTWPRIYALNKDRVQDDGYRLTDPDLIRPGWRLTIPVAQAAEPPAPLSKPAQPTKEAPPASPPKSAPSPDSGADHTPSRTHAREQAAPRAAHAVAASPSISLGDAGLIGITAAAGLLAARRYWNWHQRRRRNPNLQAEPPTLSHHLDRAAQAAHAATRPRPPHDPDALVTRRTPPPPPQAPGSVTLGTRDGHEVPLEELAAPGGCTWTGPGAENAARALLVGILTAAERRRPQPRHVHAVVPVDLADTLLPGLPEQFTALTQAADLSRAIRRAEQHLITQARARDDHDIDPGNPDAPPQPGPGTLVLLATPDAAHAGQLQALAARSRPDTLIVLTLAAALPGAEPWHIAADGTTTRLQGRPLRLFHLTLDGGRDFTNVLLTAHGERPRLRALPAPRTRTDQSDPDPEHDTPPSPASPPAAGGNTPPPPPPASPPGSGPERTAAATLPQATSALHRAQSKPVRLNVLGTITLYARGHTDPIGTNLRSEVREFLALLAAHPTGLLASDIADKLHLEPGTDSNALKNLRRAVRRALRAATGITAQEFILLQGELHKLHPDLVETDLADFARALKNAFAPAGKDATHEETLSAVSDALSHYRGPFARGSDYLWADTLREHLATQATDAVLRAARHAERPDAPPRERDTALTLLEHLAAIHPDHERLAQHAIRLYQAVGRHDAARHTFTRLQRHLAELGLEPEPATCALITTRTAHTTRKIR
ncbi:BTAD domain-containing putative transcriptional regulator [Actinacidiphila sp. bgisy167]|uniref:BTAD domain-containing putative transcriptional regulator n=1 Tax=Actinacidiphila sp. bgisy167 TaxID=3413797 RepID=UPI003D716842